MVTQPINSAIAVTDKYHFILELKCLKIKKIAYHG